jgi:NADPH:quinone reductase-like Zn-dependent oxidoreductase
MKAVIIDRYGGPDVLDMKEVSIPLINDDEILIKIKASSVNPVDWKVRKGMLRFLPGQELPKMLGGDLSGEVVKIGKNISEFKQGDEIYGMINATKGGAYAEYIAASIRQVVHKPTNLTFEEAAAVPLAALTAYQAITRLGKLKEGETICVNGCSGGVGHFAIQIAKALGAKVTGICSTKNINFAKEFGADEIVDYTNNNSNFIPTTKYDIFFDAVANQSYFKAIKFLKRKGRYVTTLPSISVLLGSIFTLFSSKRGMMINIKVNSEDLRYLSELIKSNKMKVNIDKEYNINQIQEAHRHSETGRVVGKLVLKIDQ